MRYYRNPRTTQEKRRAYRDRKYIRPGRSPRLLPNAWNDIATDDSKLPKKRCPVCGAKSWRWDYGDWWICNGHMVAGGPYGLLRREWCDTRMEIPRRRRRDRTTIRRAV